MQFPMRFEMENQEDHPATRARSRRIAKAMAMGLMGDTAGRESYAPAEAAGNYGTIYGPEQVQPVAARPVDQLLGGQMPATGFMQPPGETMEERLLRLRRGWPMY